MTGPGSTVLLVPPPTPNGALHVGHLSGPYLAADVAARAARARGERVLTVCGTDDHQNYVVTAAEQLGRDVDDVVADHTARIRDVLHRTGIRHDIFTAPRTDAAYRDGVRALLAGYTERGSLTVADRPVLVCGACGRTQHHGYVSGGCPSCGTAMGGGTCEGCGGFATAADLTDPVCHCGAAGPVARTQPGPVFRLEDFRGPLTDLWTRASLPPRVRALIAAHLDRGLPDVPVTYPSDWGLPVGDQRLDVWFEMGLAYLWSIGRRFDPAAGTVPELARAWRSVDRLWTFLGIDNAFYYAVLFPAMLLAAGVAPRACLDGLVVNEFYRLDGRKFSTSRRHAVWGEEILELAKPDAVRLFLSLDRPAPFASNFTLDGFREFVDRPEPPRSRSAGWRAREVRRAEQALTLESFDPALAVRCLLPVADDPAALRLLDLVAGRSPAVDG